jgi:phosphatidate cytidylyltransferase
MVLKRWITSIVALPILILIIAKGGTKLFSLCIAAVFMVALWEYYRIVLGEEEWKKQGLLPYVGFLTGLLMIWGAHHQSFVFITGGTVLYVLLAGVVILRQFNYDPAVTSVLPKLMLGLVYVGLSLCFIVLTRAGSDGVAWIFFLIFVVFAGDVGAFYIGTYFGTRKLCPAVSPGKTIEGAIGGLAANLLVGMVFTLLFLPPLNLGLCMLMIILMGAAGQVGDLFESAYKRVAHIKDSSNLLPGHGGVLDRIDALLFAAPVLYYFKRYLL